MSIDALKVYLKCWLNLILYYRNIYPSTSFGLKTFNVFNLPINFPINRNPILIDYIETLIEDFLDVLALPVNCSKSVVESSLGDFLSEQQIEETTDQSCVLTIGIIETDYNEEDIEYNTGMGTPKEPELTDLRIVEKFIIDFQEFDMEKFSRLENDGETYNECRESLYGLYKMLVRLPHLQDGKYRFKVFIEQKNCKVLDENWLKINLKKKGAEGHMESFNAKENLNLQTKGLLGIDLGEDLIIYEYYQSLLS